MAFTKIAAAGIGSTETVTLHSLEVLNNATVGGVLTYEDVTNVDSIGIITARAGVLVGSGITLSKDGDIFATGVTTATKFVGDGSELTGVASTENIRTNTNATFLQNINVSGTSTVGGDVNIADKIVHTGDTDTTIRFPSADTITAETGGSERLRINSSGNALFGGTAVSQTIRQLVVGSNAEANLAIETHNTSASETANIRFYRSRGTAASPTTLVDNDVISQLIFYGHDGTDYANTGAVIKVECDGTIASNSTPTAMTFFTNGGSTSATERVRITSGGDVNISKNLSVTGVTTSQTFVPSEGQLANRNLIVNGAMRVAQRGTSYTGGYSSYYKTVDRQFVYAGGLPNTDVTTSQINITTGSPYDAGFRKAFQIQMGYQGSTPADVQVAYSYRVEAQDLACSGWKHTSSSSYITLSFWVRSSVAQTFYGQLRTIDGTNYHYPFSYALSANTWTKVEKTFPGNSNLTLNNDNGEGLRIDLTPYYGTDYTNNSVSLNAWGTHSNSAKTPDQTATWYQTNGATWQITGLQLEVGQKATPFEHKLISEDFARCHRYFFKNINESGENGCNYAKAYSTSELFASVRFPVRMRATPTITAYGNSGGASTVHILGTLPDKSYTSIDRVDVYGGIRFNSSGNWATGDTDMYSFTFQAEAEL